MNINMGNYCNTTIVWQYLYSQRWQISSIYLVMTRYPKTLKEPIPMWYEVAKSWILKQIKYSHLQLNMLSEFLFELIWNWN